MRPNFLLIIALFFLTGSLQAQMQTVWNRDYYPEAWNGGALTTVDTFGNTYLAFETVPPIRFRITKLDPAGYPVWSNLYSAPGSYPNSRPSFMLLQDANLWVIGDESDTSSVNYGDLFIRKLDTSGNELAVLHKRSPGPDYPMAYHVMPNGNLLLSYARGNNNVIQPCHLLCFAPNDTTLLWDCPLNPSQNESGSWPGFIGHDNAGNILVHYSSIINNVSWHFIKKVSPNGTLLHTWAYPFNGLMNGGFSPDGTTLLTQSPFGAGPVAMIKIDSTCNTEWIDSVNSTNGLPAAISTPEQDGWILPGAAGNHVSISRISIQDSLAWRIDFPTSYIGSLWPVGGALSPDSSIFYAFYYGSILNNTSMHDFLVVRTTPSGTLIDVTTIPQPVRNDQFQGFTYAFHQNGDLQVFLDRNYQPNYSRRHKMVYRLCTGECSHNIDGKCYYDPNLNCIQDSSEYAPAYAILNLDSAQRYFMTDNLGHFNQRVEDGAHHLQQELPIYLMNTCPFSQFYAFSIDTLTPTQSNLDFGIAIDPNYHDMSLDLQLVPAARPGFSQYHALNVRNLGIAPDSGTVTLILDSVFHYLTATPPPSSISGNVYTWTLGTLLPQNIEQISIYSNVPAWMPLGTPFNSVASVTSVWNDVVPHNNQDTIDNVVTGSFDPNHKSVSPDGIRSDGHILQSDTLLTYLIQFQNLGTDTAFTVSLRDRISELLDLGTLQVINASHPFTMHMEADRTLAWDFNAINLPPASTNQLQSNGFVKYQIQLEPDLPIGTEITNQAAIYFDYNAPIHTNTVVTTIGLFETGLAVTPPGGTQAHLYPNPNSGTFAIEFDTPVQSMALHITNSQGAIIHSESHQSTGKTHFHLDLHHLPSGLFLLSTQSDGRLHRFKFIKQ